jgi:hypothetical protein
VDTEPETFSHEGRSVLYLAENVPPVALGYHHHRSHTAADLERHFNFLFIAVTNRHFPVGSTKAPHGDRDNGIAQREIGQNNFAIVIGLQRANLVIVAT